MAHTHGTKWTEELIKQKVLEVKEGLQLDRMPSRKECEEWFHDCALANAITKRMGWYALARDMGLAIKDSETWFGKAYEAIAQEMLQSRGFEVSRMSQNFPYDLLVDNCVKVDVKASKLYRGKNGDFYTYNLEKKYATCDFYILFQVADDNTIMRVMVVPSKQVVAQTQISVGVEKSKYHKYTDRWDLLYNAVHFWDDMAVSL